MLSYIANSGVTLEINAHRWWDSANLILSAIFEVAVDFMFIPETHITHNSCGVISINQF